MKQLKTLVAVEREREREHISLWEGGNLLFKLSSSQWSKGGIRSSIETSLVSRDLVE